MAKEVTLKQVAARAGVSYQTVSKVLNKQAKVTRETEERIWRAVRELSYRPNLLARNMRQQRSQLIGYSWEPTPGDQCNPILDKFLQSMSQATEEAGYHLLTFPHHPGSKSLDIYEELIDSNRVDGFVLSSIEYDDPRITFLHEKNFPFVAFGRSNPGQEFMFVDIDGCRGIQKVMEHLLELGHRRIFTLAWPESSRVGQNRFDGYLAAMQDASIYPEAGWIARGEGNYSFGYQATEKWLNAPKKFRPTAIVCMNDFMAIGAMNAIHHQGYRVGEDIAVTGFDDIPLVQYLTPALTSVRQPLWQVGQVAISLLIRRLEGESCENEHILIPPVLIVRQSSDPTCLVEIQN